MSNKWLDYLLIAGIAIFPMLFIWQGLDLTDSGYWVSNYQQFFPHPENAGAILWLSIFIGAVWNALFGALGLISFKIAYVVLIYAMCFILYQMMKDLFDDFTIFLALFITVMFCSIGFTNWLSYNDLTGFFYVVAVYFMYRGLVEKSAYFLFISGIVIGLNIFVRPPNIVGLSFLLPILFYAYLQKETFSAPVKSLGMFISGTALAVVSVCLLMVVMGHWSFYVEGMISLYGLAMDGGSHHSGKGLLSMLWRDHVQVLKSIWPVILGLSILSVVTSFIKLKPLVLAIIALFIAYFSMDYLQSGIRWKWLPAGILYLFLGMMAFNPKGRMEIRVIGFISLLVLFIAPLGSGNGIRNSVFGMWLALPIALAYWFSLHDLRVCFLRLNLSQILLIRYCLVFSLVAFSINEGYHYTYRDTVNRLDMTHSIDHPMLRGIYTTQQRAEVVQELLDELTKHVKEDDYLLAYDYIPALNAITKTQPYLYSSWPMLYSASDLKEKINMADKERGYLPVVVRATGSTYNFEWPKEDLGESKKESYIANRKIIQNFLNSKSYGIVWGNGYFQILKQSHSTYNEGLILSK